LDLLINAPDCVRLCDTCDECDQFDASTTSCAVLLLLSLPARRLVPVSLLQRCVTECAVTATNTPVSALNVARSVLRAMTTSAERECMRLTLTLMRACVNSNNAACDRFGVVCALMNVVTFDVNVSLRG
jgi:hypothetical protein